jgi:hypothetical protein
LSSLQSIPNPPVCALSEFLPRIGPRRNRAEERDTFTRLPWLPDEGHREGVQMSDSQGVSPVRWPVWSAVPRVELWQAVALTLGIEPTDDLRRTDLSHGPRGGGPFRRLRGEFWDRLSVCKQGMSIDGPIRPQGPLYTGILRDNRCPVLLSEVVEFLSKAAFEIPAELQPTDASSTPGAPAASLAEPVRFADLPRVMAEAMHADPMARAGARINLEAELVEMVASGRLKVRDSLTLGPHTYPVGDALKNAVLLPDEVRQLLAERGVSVPAVPVPASAPTPSASAPAVAVPEPVAAPAEVVPVLGAGRRRTPTVQEAIAPYVAKLMRERPDYTAEALYQRMRRDAGNDGSPLFRSAQGGKLFCVETGKSCGSSTVSAALTDYRKTHRKHRSSTVEAVEAPSNP